MNFVRYFCPSCGWRSGYLCKETSYSSLRCPACRSIIYEWIEGGGSISVKENVSKPIINNIAQHLNICTELNELYKKKNHDYGDSFHQTYLEEGMAMPRIRLTDKFNRFKALTLSGEQNIKDESIRDTLIDLANYAIMTVMELDRKKGE